MPYTKNNPPERIKGLPLKAKNIWISAFNNAFSANNRNEEISNKIAWSAVKKKYKKVNNKWVEKEVIR